MAIDRFLVGSLIIGGALAACGHDQDTSVTFTSLQGVVGERTTNGRLSEALVFCEGTAVCVSPILAIARSKEEVVQWMTDLPIDAVKVNFPQQMAAIWSVPAGTSFQYTVDYVTDGNEEIVINGTLCRVSDPVAFNFQIRVGIAIGSSTKSVVARTRVVWDADNGALNTQNYPVESCKKRL